MPKQTIFEELLDRMSRALMGEDDPKNPAVLSCGGLFFPQRKIPLQVRTWHPIVHVPGEDSSARVFGVQPTEPTEELNLYLHKEFLN